jgi:hypothetical protein
MRNAYTILVRKSNGKGRFGDLDVDVTIILILILKKLAYYVWI